MKQLFCFLIAVLFCSFCFSQKKAEFSLLGESYYFSYDEIDSKFGICIKTASSLECSYKEVDQKDPYATIPVVQKFIDVFFNDKEFVLLSKKTTLSALNDDLKDIDNAMMDFSDIEIELELKGLLAADKKKDTVFIEDGGRALYFLIENSALTKFNLESVGEIALFDTFEFTFTDVLATHRDQFIDEVKTQIRNELEAEKQSVLQKVKEYIGTIISKNLKEFYETEISKSDSFQPLRTVEFTLTDSKQKAFTLGYLLKSDKIHLELCDYPEAKECLKYEFESSISETGFVERFYALHPILELNNDNNNQILKQVYDELNRMIETSELRKQNKDLRDEITKVTDSIDEKANNYSGQLVLHDRFGLYQKGEKKKFLGMNFGSKKNVKSEYEFEVDFVTVRLYNNRADQIAITGHLNNEPKRTQVLKNRIWSLPLRELNNRTQTNTLTTENGEELYYRYDDVLNYIPTDRHNYAVGNAEVRLEPGDSVKIRERKIGDYFTGVFFSDILGLNSDNDNSLITAEARVRIPFNLRNYKRLTFFDNITAYGSVLLVGGLDENSRNIELMTEGSRENLSTSLDNFELLKANNVDLGINVSPLSFEWKGASTFIQARYGLRFLRTGANYQLETNINDVNGNPDTLLENRSLQIYSIGQEAELNFEIRPQSSVGLDLTVGLNWFGSTGSNSNEIDISTTNNSYNLKVLANLFTFFDTQKSKAGLFLRIGGHYNKDLSEVFPQLLVGYATNLTSFVNKFNSDKDDK